MFFDYRKRESTTLEIHIDGTIIKSKKNTKFLGVILDNKLQWKDHYEQLKTKINRNYSLLCKSKNLLNVHGMKVLYYAQIYSHLSYCIVLWGSMLSVEVRRKLRALQNKCVKLLNLNKTTNYSYKKYGILTLEHIIDLEQKKLGYKLNHGDLPQNLEKLLLTNSLGAPLNKQHCYNTRKKQLPNLPQHKSKIYNDSFLLQGLKKYNSLDAEVKKCKTLDSFSRLVKKKAIMSYNV